MASRAMTVMEQVPGDSGEWFRRAFIFGVDTGINYDCLYLPPAAVWFVALCARG